MDRKALKRPPLLEERLVPTAGSVLQVREARRIQQQPEGVASARQDHHPVGYVVGDAPQSEGKFRVSRRAVNEGASTGVQPQRDDAGL